METAAARMIDVGGKPETVREAVAVARLRFSKRHALRALPKGDSLACARVAGIMAAKRTADLIPLCHPLGLDAAEVSFRETEDGLLIRAKARTSAKTGVEMEALTAASVAALTVYDMVKGQDQAIEIGPIYLKSKTGGKSDYRKDDRLPEDGWL